MRDNGRYVNKKGYIVKHQNHIFRTAIIVLFFTSIASILMAVFLGFIVGKWVFSKPDFLIGTVVDTPYNILDWLSVALSYVGAIIGGMASGIVAIVGVYWTINYERNKDREEKRIENIPMLVAKADFEGLSEDKDTRWSGGFIRLPFNVDYELLENSVEFAREMKEGLLSELEAEIKENPDKSVEMQTKYDEIRALINNCEITKAEGLASVLEMQVEDEKDRNDSKIEKEVNLVIDSLHQMEEMGYHDLTSPKKKKSIFRFRQNRRLYIKSETKNRRIWTRNLSELDCDYNRDICIAVTLENSGGVGYVQEIISEDGQVWECDYPVSSTDKTSWFNIITEKNAFSKISFWIKYKDVLNNSYYQRFTLHPWFHIPGYLENVYPPETLETDAPYLEV